MSHWQLLGSNFGGCLVRAHRQDHEALPLFGTERDLSQVTVEISLPDFK
jgi:hypothetical protein